MSVDYLDTMPEPISISDMLYNFKDIEYILEYRFVPEDIKLEIAIKLFTDTPASGDKGVQDDILYKLCDMFRVDELYNMGLISDDTLIKLYQNYLEEEYGE